MLVKAKEYCFAAAQPRIWFRVQIHLRFCRDGWDASTLFGKMPQVESKLDPKVFSEQCSGVICGWRLLRASHKGVGW